MELSPTDIIIPPRQRKAEIDEHFVKSISQRLIQPIVLRQTDDGPTLVVGARRLMAMKQLGFASLIEGEHFKFIHDLSLREAKEVELEENIKRAPLEWREHIRALVDIFTLMQEEEPTTPKMELYGKLATHLSMSVRNVQRFMAIHAKLDSPLLRDARNPDHAYSILQIEADRKAGSIVDKISETGSQIFSTGPTSGIVFTENLKDTETATPATGDSPSPNIAQPANAEPSPPSDSILCLSFETWLETYTGPKFNLIHCDFPYGVEYKAYGTSNTSTSDDYDTKGFDNLLGIFTKNLDKFCSYQAHLVFWFSMEFYHQTFSALNSVGFAVQRHPLIWFKSDNSGIIPGRDNQYPRRVYETAFLCSRGARPLVKSLANLYAAPLPTSSIHPSQKSEPMLRHFFSMLIDETTDVFDPTCGSGAAIRVAESLNARKVLGLEVNPDYAKRANIATNTARQMRKVAI